MNEKIKMTSLSIASEPEKLLLRDGTCFTRTSAGAYNGDPTPRQVLEIQGHFSDHSRIGFVRTLKVEQPPVFEIDYFLRET